MGRIFWLWGGTAARFAAMNVGGSVPNAPRRGQDPSLRCKGYGVVMARLRAWHARPLRTAVNGLWTKGAREGGGPLLFPLTGCCGRLRAAYMPSLHVGVVFCGFPPAKRTGGIHPPGMRWRRQNAAGRRGLRPPTPVGANIVRLRSLAVATKLSN